MWKTSASRLPQLKTGLRQRFLHTSRRSRQGEKDAKPVETKPQEKPAVSQAIQTEPVKKSGGIFFKLLGLTTVASGGVVGYAWYDQSFRKQLEDNVPYSKEFFQTAFSYLPENTFNQKKPSIESSQRKSSVDEQEKPIWKKREERMSKEEEKPIQDKKPEVTSKEAKPMTDKEKKKAEIDRRIKLKEQEEKSENAALEVILEKLLENGAEKVKKAQTIQAQVVETTKTHSKLLKTAMEDKDNILEKEMQWQATAKAFECRQDTTRSAKNFINHATLELEKLKHALDTGKQDKVTKKNKMLQTSQKKYNDLSKDINAVITQIAKSDAEAKVMLKYKDLIEEGKKQFKRELESIMPEVKIGDRRGQKMTEEEMNSLIAHAHRRIEQLQVQLADQQSFELQRMDAALDQQQNEDEKVADVRVSQECQRMKNDLALEKEKWDTEARVQFEQELRWQLSRQAAAHSDHLSDVLKVQQSELDNKFENDMNVKLLEERKLFDLEVAGWIARLKGIEAAVEGRAEAEKIARIAQALWLACIALNGTIRDGNEGAETGEDKLKPLVGDCDKIREIGGSHPFINSIINSIPDEAIKRGVWTEDELTQRFYRMKRVAKKVAMIDETGGSLFKYFISYVQSFFIFDSLMGSTNIEEVDPTTLNTFTILSHANYWLKQGDLELAVRFINQLNGEPRRVASDWLKEAKLLLEARQAAFALTAFASASGLGTIF